MKLWYVMSLSVISLGASLSVNAAALKLPMPDLKFFIPSSRNSTQSTDTYFDSSDDDMPVRVKKRQVLIKPVPIRSSHPGCSYEQKLSSVGKMHEKGGCRESVYEKALVGFENRLRTLLNVERFDKFAATLPLLKHFLTLRKEQRSAEAESLLSESNSRNDNFLDLFADSIDLNAPKILDFADDANKQWYKEHYDLFVKLTEKQQVVEDSALHG